ncbi:hypothetical protein GQ55_3G235900 [Panicum hallii var. hallii]|uniref:Uncharacterized protein n=1 Tax=Panicum hallii var. hallii TaxID=1504633 RepID=A0A2T7ECM7_9POAL|nr:hypothetical protein GQ55_3G235900 [Panicum hallii var. hallii]
MAGGSRGSRRRGRICRRRGGSKLSVRGEGNGDIVVKPGSRSCGEGFCFRGHRIRQVGRMRVDANGDVYIPYSEDEESGMDVEAGATDGVADFGGASGAADGMQMALVGVPDETITVGADGVADDGFDVVAEGVPADAIEIAALGVLLMVSRLQKT